MKTNILAVDDDSLNLVGTKELLQGWGFSVDTAETADAALKFVQSAKDYAVILLDYRMPEITGAELAVKIRKINDEASIVIYSCDESREALKESLNVKVDAFIEKDEDIPSFKRQLDAAIQKYENVRTLKSGHVPEDSRALLAEIGMVGVSASTVRVAALAKRFRTMDDPVLITGETGAGKELIARALHDPSTGGFQAINCANSKINGPIVEAELFGYEKGAFTGADKRKIGILESLNRGTVFLDELHHLSPAAQAGILRAIREKTIRRLGGTEEIKIHCRIIAATKPDIHEKAKTGEFLPDLYFRLKILMIEVPPLRERKEDIPLLVQHFCNIYNRKNGTNRRFQARAVRALEEHSWPGNVGELYGAVTTALALTSKNAVEPGDLGSEFNQPFENVATTDTPLKDFDARQSRDRLRFIESIVSSSDSRRHAARRLGITESTLRGQLERTRTKGIN